MSERNAPSFYVRKASGLVRDVSVVDVVFYNILQIGIPYLTFLVYTWVYYPGANIEWPIIICIVGSTAMTIAYGMFSAIFPRSGAEYVYLTRSGIPPVLGFIFSWINTVWQLWALGLNASSVGYGAISPMFTSLSLITGNKSLLGPALWAQSPLGRFIIGMVVLTFFAVLFAVGMKKYFVFQNVLFIVAAIGFVIALVLMATTTQATFILRFNTFMHPFSSEPDAYHAIINTAQQNGLALGVPFSGLQTLRFTIWVYLAMAYAMLSSNFAGEVKNVKRSQPLGMVLAVWIAGIAFLAWTYLSENIFGKSFILAASYIDINVPSKEIIPTTPFTNLFAALLTDNLVLATWILLSFALFTFFFTGVLYVYISRYILAWSIDRLTPDKLGEVNEKYHSPLWAYLVVFIGGSIFTALYAFAGSTYILVNFVIWTAYAMSFSFGATVLVAAFFPYFKKSFYHGSGGEVEIAGVPIMTIAGVIATVYVGSMIYFFATDTLVGTASTLAAGSIALVSLVGGIFYYGFKWYRKKQGIDITLAYKQVPIE